MQIEERMLESFASHNLNEEGVILSTTPRDAYVSPGICLFSEHCYVLLVLSAILGCFNCGITCRHVLLELVEVLICKRKSSQMIDSLELLLSFR